MHPIDLFWGVLALAGAALPLFRLYDNLHRDGATHLFALVLACALYPWASIVQTHTFFDHGLTFAISGTIGPFYLSSIIRYLGVPVPGWRYVRNTLFAFTGIISLIAITNPWHGQYATFQPPTPGMAGSMLRTLHQGVGMQIMGVINILCIIIAVALISYRYTRSRFHTSHLLATTVFPIAAGFVFVLRDSIANYFPSTINPFFLATTAGLMLLSFALLRHQFLELRPIARERLLNLMPDAMVIVSPNGMVVDCNAVFAALWDKHIRDCIGTPVHSFLPAEFECEPADESEGRTIHVTIADGKRLFELRTARLHPGSRSSECMVLMRDITEQARAEAARLASETQLRRANAELERLSNTDPLTGLRNRRYFMDRLEHELERAARTQKSFGLLSIDLDHFKRINDQFGHGSGDEALVQVARALEQYCRATDTLARMGGEEFMVLLVDTGATELRIAAERFRNAVELITVKLHTAEPLRLTASIGGVIASGHEPVNTLLKRADDALYRAKHEGRNRTAI